MIGFGLTSSIGFGKMPEVTPHWPRPMTFRFQERHSNNHSPETGQDHLVAIAPSHRLLDQILARSLVDILALEGAIAKKTADLQKSCSGYHELYVLSISRNGRGEQIYKIKQFYPPFLPHLFPSMHAKTKTS
jgi:hypothetical protein